MTIWKPAEIDVSGMERLAVHGFSGEHGNAIVNALQRRLWNNEFYSIVDRRPAEPIRPVSAGGEIGGPLSLDDLDAARRAGIDGLIVGDVIDFHCEDQPVSTQDQMREWIPQFRQENSNVDRDESRISAAGSTSRRHATVTVAFRLIHTESGRICLSRQISHSSSDLVDDRSHASPTATETLQILTRQCVDDFVCLLEPHPVTEPVKLAEPTLFQAGYSLVHNGNEFAIRGRWDEAIGAWEQALEANPDNGAALFNLSIAHANRQEFTRPETFAIRAMNVRQKDEYQAGLQRIREQSAAYDQTLRQRRDLTAMTLSSESSDSSNLDD